MKKKLIAVLFTGIMAASMCAVPVTAEEELTKLYWQWPTVGDVGDALYEVEAEFNTMLADEGIPAEVEFIPCSTTKSQQEATLMVSAGEQLDIMLTAFTAIDSLVNSNLILPLDDIIEEYGADILEKSHSSTECLYGGQMYGVAVGNEDYDAAVYLAKTKYLEKYGIEIDPEKVYSMDELEEIFATVKAGEGDDLYCLVPWAGTNDPGNYQYFAMGKPSGSLSAGCLLFSERGFDDTTIVNLFETEEYAEYANRMYKWAQAGYIAPDAAVTTEAPDDIIAQDNYMGVFYFGYYGSGKDYGAVAKTEFTEIKIHEPYRSGLGAAGVMWNIPVTTVNKELALQVLNFIYKNTDAATLLQRGREGIEYEVTETDENGKVIQIKMLSDDVSSLPYHQSLGIYGCSLDWPAMAPNTYEASEMRKEIDKNLPEDRIFIGAGYSFDGSEYAAEIAAIETVMSQYCMVINCGAADPEIVLPEFIDALKAAGIDEVVAENQKQLDEFMTAKAE